MVTLVVTACPAGLRGHITRWLLEVSPGVFVGVISRRVRDLLWARIVDNLRDGRAIMITSARNEQRLSFQVHGHDWQPVDMDGVALMMRPHTGESLGAGGVPRSGWSKASRYRRANRARRQRAANDGS